MHFIAECGIEYGFQFVTQFSLNPPDCLYTKKFCDFLQSHEKSREEQNKLACFFFRDGVTSRSRPQSYEKSSATQKKNCCFSLTYCGSVSRSGVDHGLGRLVSAQDDLHCYLTKFNKRLCYKCLRDLYLFVNFAREPTFLSHEKETVVHLPRHAGVQGLRRWLDDQHQLPHCL